MKKGVAGQTIGAQMVSATDGSAFTGAVTVYVTGNAGAQGVGSVGAGACTHEGNGFHTYAPAQAETNYDHVAFTFTGSGAIPGTVQVYPSFPQTGDNFARLGAPAGADIAADVAAIKAQTAAIETDTAEIGAAGAGLTAVASAANLAIVDDFLDTEIAAIKAKTDNLPADPADASDILAAVAVIQADTDDIQTRLPAALVAGRIDASVGAMAANVMTAAAAAADLTTELQSGLATAAALATVDDFLDTEVAAIKGVTDKLDTALVLDGAVYQLTANALELGPTGSPPTAAAIADEVQTRTIAAVTVVNGLAANVITAAATAADFTTEIQSGLATAANLATVAGYVDTEVTAIFNRIGAPAGASIAADIAGIVPTDVSAIAADVAVIREYADNTVIRGTVSATAPSTTGFTSSALSPAGVDADQFKGRIIVFDNDTTTLALRGQATDITANSGAANPTFTFTALTTAPVSGDTFSVV